jgi:hypothetical protein
MPIREVGAACHRILIPKNMPFCGECNKNCAPSQAYKCSCGHFKSSHSDVKAAALPAAKMAETAHVVKHNEKDIPSVFSTLFSSPKSVAPSAKKVSDAVAKKKNKLPRGLKEGSISIKSGLLGIAWTRKFLVLTLSKVDLYNSEADRENGFVTGTRQYIFIHSH